MNFYGIQNFYLKRVQSQLRAIYVEYRLIYIITTQINYQSADFSVNKKSLSI